MLPLVACSPLAKPYRQVNRERSSSESASAPSPPSPSSSSTPLVWAFGDSLTAGLHSCRNSSLESCSYSPYAPALEKELRRNGHAQVKVKHLGYSGWTSVELRTMPRGDAQQPDLKFVLERDRPTLAVLLVGSNDLGRRGAASEADISSDVWRLHTIAHGLSVPTVAVGIPPTGYGMGVRNREEYEAARRGVNTLLRQRCELTPNMCAFADNPVTWSWMEDWEPDPGCGCEADGIHMSRRGYGKLGAGLAPVVGEALTVHGKKGQGAAGQEASLPTHALEFEAPGRKTCEPGHVEGCLPKLATYQVTDVSSLLDQSSATTADGPFGSSIRAVFEVATHGFAIGHSESLVHMLDTAAFEAAAWHHDMLFARLEPIGKVIVERLSGKSCRSVAHKPQARKYRGLFTNAFTAQGGAMKLSPLEEGGAERRRLRAVYSTHDDAGAAASSALVDDGDTDLHQLWLPVIHERVEQWPLVLANRTNAQARAAAGKGAGLDGFDWSSVPWVFAHRMRLGDFILLRAGVAIHADARLVDGPAPDTPRAAVVFEYRCGVEKEEL